MFLMFMNMKTVHVVLLVWLVSPHYLQVATVNPKGLAPSQINLLNQTQPMKLILGKEIQSKYDCKTKYFVLSLGDYFVVGIL